MVAGNVPYLGLLGAGEDVMSDAKRDAEKEVEAMVSVVGALLSAWGGGESACVLAFALGMRVLNYDETTGQAWPHNQEAAANGTIRTLHLDWGRYRILRPMH